MPTVPGKYINREGRNEFQLFVALMCIISGSSQLISGYVAPSIAQFPMLIEYSWAVGLLAGGLCVLSAATAHSIEHNRFPVVAEFSGLFLLFGMFLVYGVAVVSTVDGAEMFNGPIFVVLGLACLSRAIRVFRWYIKPREEKLVDEIRVQLTNGIEHQARALAKGRIDTNGVPIPLPITTDADGAGSK